MKYIWVFSCLLSAWSVNGQDPHFTQFYANALYLSPSFAGATEQHRVAASFRDQWPTVPKINTFVTYTLAYDHFFSNFNSGIGLLFMKDVAGSGGLSNLNVGLSYSYDFQIFNFWHVRPGASFIYKQRSIDFQKLIFYSGILDDDEYRGVEPPPGDASFNDFDASASILVYADKIWFGTTVDHLTQPQDAFYKLNAFPTPMKVSVFGGYQIIRKGRLLKPIDETVSVAFHYKNQKPIDQLDLGLYWYKTPVVFGLWYRGIPMINKEKVGDMLAVLVGAKIPQFSVGYSYDFTISKLAGQTGGAHEISLVYEFKTSRRRKIHAIPCPEF